MRVLLPPLQVLFLLYHYFDAKEVYNAIRVFIAGYVWLTGYGNFSYYYRSNDFSIGRWAGAIDGVAVGRQSGLPDFCLAIGTAHLQRCNQWLRCCGCRVGLVLWLSTQPLLHLLHVSPVKLSQVKFWQQAAYSSLRPEK